MEDKIKSIDNLKCGYVIIIGRPNTGKSTFINTLIGEKVSIVSPVPQTTRRKITGIYNDAESQIVFLDTPGIHNGQFKVNEKLNEEALGTLQDADIVLYFVDGSRPSGEEEKYLQGVFEKLHKPKIKVLTKSDIHAKEEENTISISSVSKKGFEELLHKIKLLLPFGPSLYPEDYYTSQTVQERIEEVVREKIFLHLKDEIPHSCFVEVEEIEDTLKLLKAMTYVYVETESQKKILIGKAGSVLTTLGKEAREDLEKIFGKKMFLSLRVKVSPKWRQNEKIISKILSK